MKFRPDPDIIFENDLKAKAATFAFRALADAGDHSYGNFGLDINSNPIVSRRKLHAYVDQFVEATIKENKKKPEVKSQFVVFSGGSASNVGALVKALELSGAVNPKAMLKLDSEAIIDSGAVPAFTEMAANGYKHPEKMTQDNCRLFQHLLIDAADYYYRKLHAAGVAGTIVMDDHCENLDVAMAIATQAKELMHADTGYICVARDPRLGIESARARVKKNGGAITPKLQLDTYRMQPHNWETLSRCKHYFDVALLTEMNRAHGTIPEIIARRVGTEKAEALNPEEIFCFNCAKDIPKDTYKENEIFAVDPHVAYKKKQEGGIVRKKDHKTVSFEEALHPKDLIRADSFAQRIQKDAAAERGV